MVDWLPWSLTFGGNHDVDMVLSADRGVQGAMPFSYDLLTAMIGTLPPQSIFCVSAVGPAGAASRHDAGDPAGRTRPGWAGGQLLQPRPARDRRDAGGADGADHR